MPQSLSVRLDADTQERLKKLAEEQDRSPHYLMKKAIEAFVLDAEFEKSEYDITMGRLRHYEQTGRYVTGDDVRKWAAALPRRGKSSA